MSLAAAAYVAVAAVMAAAAARAAAAAADNANEAEGSGGNKQEAAVPSLLHRRTDACKATASPSVSSFPPS